MGKDCESVVFKLKGPPRLLLKRNVSFFAHHATTTKIYRATTIYHNRRRKTEGEKKIVPWSIFFFPWVWFSGLQAAGAAARSVFEGAHEYVLRTRRRSAAVQ